MKARYGAILSIAAAGALVPVTALHASAPAGRYVIDRSDTNHMTVFDTKTKLTWERGFGVPVTYQEAVERCQSIVDDNAEIGWRLPTVKELLTLVDYGGSFGTALIDGNAFPGTRPETFWSATPSASDTPPFRCVDFSSGFIGCNAMNTARCVR
jgi:hypothetical protein